MPSISISPLTATVTVGGMQTFTATVSGTTNTQVTWAVNAIGGGNATVGTISASGLYTAPAAVPNPPQVTVTATSVVDTTKSASATVTVQSPVTSISISPLTATVTVGGTQTFTATVSGTTNTQVTWAVNAIAGGNATVGTISASGLYTAPAALPNPSQVTVTASLVVDMTKSVSATVTVQNPVTSISISPLTANVTVGGMQTFTATVSGTTNTQVTWAVNGIAGGNATVGTISASGLYAAPAAVPNPSQVTVTAGLVVDMTKSASATVTVQSQPASQLSFAVVGNTQSSSFPVTNGSTAIGAPTSNGIVSILTRGSGSTALTFSTYLGPATQLRVMWQDPVSKDIFVGGRSHSPDFPTTAGAFQTTFGGGPDDAVICRFTSAGVKKWCSYLGTAGSNDEETVYGICGIDSNGYLGVAGRMNFIANGTMLDGVSVRRIGTSSESKQMGYTAKIFDNDGASPPQLVWFTGWGGSTGDGNRGRCTMDSDGNIYGEGDTESIADFPTTPGVFQPTSRDATSAGSGEIYEMRSDGTAFVWASYIGGKGLLPSTPDADEGGIVLDANGDIYVAGSTSSADMFVGGNATGYQKTIPSGDGFPSCYIAHIKGDGTAILDSTFLGGTTGGITGRQQQCDGIALDGSGNVVVVGETVADHAHQNFPITSGAYQTEKPSGNNVKICSGFVAKFSADLSTLIASTYIGGDSEIYLDNSGSLAFDANGNIWSVAPSQTPTAVSFPTTPDALYPNYIGNGWDIAIFALTPDLKNLVYGSYLGGTVAQSPGIGFGNWSWALGLLH
ncbi:MAG TPA: hypothetical protein VKM93_09735 [Terriglobia bacterium]|nr:hypothetical protein [Terriglobia bacterium]